MPPQAETGPNVRDFQIAVCRAFGMTIEDTATAISTAEFPTGMSSRTVSSRLKSANSHFIAEIVKWVSSLRRAQALDVKEVTIDTIRDEIRKDLGQSLAVVKAAIKNGDTDLAVWHIEQVIGRASQTHRVSGSVDVNHAHFWRPESVFAQQERDLADSRNLLPAPSEELSGEIQDAELVNA